MIFSKITEYCWNSFITYRICFSHSIYCMKYLLFIIPSHPFYLVWCDTFWINNFCGSKHQLIVLSSQLPLKSKFYVEIAFTSIGTSSYYLIVTRSQTILVISRWLCLKISLMRTLIDFVVIYIFPCYILVYF